MLRRASSAAILVAAALSFSDRGDASEYVVTATASVQGGIDQDGLFGPVGASLNGDLATITFTFDSALGTAYYGPPNAVEYGVAFFAPTTITTTINGHSFSASAPGYFMLADALHVIGDQGYDRLQAGVTVPETDSDGEFLNIYVGLSTNSSDFVPSLSLDQTLNGSDAPGDGYAIPRLLGKAKSSCQAG